MPGRVEVDADDGPGGVNMEVGHGADDRLMTPVWSVGALLLAVADALGARFGAVTVRGELSSLSRPASGHLYFSLKDDAGQGALMRCVMFRRAASLLDFAPAEGHQIELRGRLAVYEPRGDLQFVAESMRRLGAGSLYEEFLRLRARLQAQGLFDPQRRRPLMRFPRAVGVVTSLGAAALQDVLTALARRAPQVHVIVYPCLVQGAEAPASIIQALSLAGQRAEVDTVLLVRGGGSLEDLWAFNDERVVRTVAACPLPVVCGVGHETDITLSDLAADLRAPTPTAAAELAAPDREQALAALDPWQQRLARALRQRLDRESQRLDLLARRAGVPAAGLARAAERLDGLQWRLATALASRLARSTQMPQGLQGRLGRAAQVALVQQSRRLDALAHRLAAAHPAAVLGRGFAWIESSAGAAITRAADARPGQRISAVLADGRLHAQVRDVELDPPQDAPLPAP
jgi:exodeoxyribonuclease VII large subunit